MNQQNLKLPIRTEKVIDECDWSNFVSVIYGRPYRLQQQGECYPNGSNEYVDVPNDEDEEDWVNVNLNDWLAKDPNDTGIDWMREFYPSLHTIANDLHNKGLLEAGSYTIHISW